MIVLREKPPPCPPRPGHITHKGTGYFPKLKTHPGLSWQWAGNPWGSRAGRGVLESRVKASHPGWARTPRPWLRPKSALFTECQLCSPPPPTTSPGVLGDGRGQAGPEGAQEAVRSQACLSVLSPSWLRGSISPCFPVFLFPLQSILKEKSAEDDYYSQGKFG